jgi:hypothetical protein
MPMNKGQWVLVLGVVLVAAVGVRLAGVSGRADRPTGRIAAHPTPLNVPAGHEVAFDIARVASAAVDDSSLVGIEAGLRSAREVMRIGQIDGADGEIFGKIGDIALGKLCTSA